MRSRRGVQLQPVAAETVEDTAQTTKLLYHAATKSGGRQRLHVCKATKGIQDCRHHEVLGTHKPRHVPAGNTSKRTRNITHITVFAQAAVRKLLDELLATAERHKPIVTCLNHGNSTARRRCV